MRDKEASSTALFALMVRAYHQRFDAEPKILDDPASVALAKHFQGAGGNPLWVWPRQILNPARAAVIVRSRFAEDVLREVATTSPCQYVILGAGFDTFAHRRPPWAEAIPVFEVDHPATQESKRLALSQLAFYEPDNLRYCPVDLQRTPLPDALRQAGFDFDTPAVFAWLGVTMYITEAAIRSTLEFISSLPRSTTVVFTFVPTDSSLPDDERRALSGFIERAAAGGEPFISRFAPTEILGLLGELRYKDVRHVLPTEAQDLYFTGRTDGLAAASIEQVIQARV